MESKEKKIDDTPTYEEALYDALVNSFDGVYINLPKGYIQAEFIGPQTPVQTTFLAPECECGLKKVNADMIEIADAHSSWCPVYTSNKAILK